jgi:hypothetical protein
LGPLLFIVYINDLPRPINHFTNVVPFADDTSILITEKIMKISIERLSSLEIVLADGLRQINYILI